MGPPWNDSCPGRDRCRPIPSEPSGPSPTRGVDEESPDAPASSAAAAPVERDDRDPAHARRRAPRPAFEPLNPSRIMARGVDVFRAYALGFMAFAALLVASISGPAFIAEALAASLALPALLVHTIFWIAGPAPLAAGFYVVVFVILRGGKPRFGDFFAGYAYIVPMGTLTLFAAAIVWLLTAAQMPLLVVGAGYLGFALMYTVPLLVDCGLGAFDAMVLSWRLTHATFVDSLFVLIVVVLTSIAGAAFFGIGLLASIPTAGCMLAVAYGQAADSPWK